jgi:hypothetical protein
VLVRVMQGKQARIGLMVVHIAVAGHELLAETPPR